MTYLVAYIVDTQLEGVEEEQLVEKGRLPSALKGLNVERRPEAALESGNYSCFDCF